MIRPALARRPALPVALALVFGVALRGASDRPRSELLACALAGAALCFALSSRRLIPRILVPLFALALGLRAIDLAGIESLRRTDAWLPRDGAPARVEVEGTLAGAPERASRGERRLVLDAHPAAGGTLAPASRLQLRVLESPTETVAGLDALRAGDEVRVFASVRVPFAHPASAHDPRLALLAKGFDATGTVKSARLVRLRSEGGGPARWLSSAKAAARRRLDRAVGTEGTARELLGAMILGDRGLVEARSERALRDAGLIHLLSVSGLHVALAIAGVGWIVRRVTAGVVSRMLVSLPVIVALTLFVGAGPPAVRAGLSAGLVLLGRAIGREGESVNSLAVAAAILIFAHPPSLWDASFRLTFGATLGILLFAGRIASVLPVWRPIALSIGVSVAAYATSAPICMLEFGAAAPSAVLSNLGGAILCAWVMATGTGAIVCVGAPVIGAAFAAAARFGAEALLQSAELCSHLPGAAFRTASPSVAMLAAYYGALFALACLPSHRERSPRKLLIPARDPLPSRSPWAKLLQLTVALLLGAMHLGPIPVRPGAAMSVAVIDVGQGQAVAVSGPSGVVLVDAGGSQGGRFDAGSRIVARELAAHGARRIEALIVTHAHDDHAGGALSILREFEVGELWLGLGYPHDDLARRLVASAVERGVAVVLVEDGFSQRRAGLALHVLHPSRRDAGLSDNDRSVVVLVQGSLRSLLVPGDLERRGEARLLDCHRDELGADLLVLPHHGARESSSPAFLDAVHPTVAVVSAGRRNRFGHPHPAVLDRVRSGGALVRRTDQDGTVRLVLSDTGISVEPSFRRGNRTGPFERIGATAMARRNPDGSEAEGE